MPVEEGALAMPADDMTFLVDCLKNPIGGGVIAVSNTIHEFAKQPRHRFQLRLFQLLNTLSYRVIILKDSSTICSLYFNVSYERASTLSRDLIPFPRCCEALFIKSSQVIANFRACRLTPKLLRRLVATRMQAPSPTGSLS
jgi:hypothetical protein